MSGRREGKRGERREEGREENEEKGGRKKVSESEDFSLVFLLFFSSSDLL